MSFLVVLILWAVLFAVSALLTPKPKITNARPAGLGDFSFPTATEGRPVPLIWGKVRIDGPNVVWYGDLKRKAIDKSVSTGMFSSSTQILGYKYFVGMQFALCRGEVDFLSRIWINEKVVFDGSIGGGGATFIDQPKLFGGSKQGGGVQGNFRFYVGDHDQLPNGYINNTPPDFLWLDNYGDGTTDATGVGDVTIGIPLSEFKGSLTESYYSVSTSSFGPGSGDSGAERMVTMDGTEGVHARTQLASGAPGDLNRYCAMLMHPDRPRISNNVRVVASLRAKPDVLDFDDIDMWFGCKCKDVDDMTSQDGVFVLINHQAKITVVFHSPTSGGGVTLATLTAPTDFTDLSSDLHEFTLEVTDDRVVVKLDGSTIVDETDSRILDIDTDYCGVVIGVAGNMNTEFFSANDWSATGFYSLGIDSTVRNIVADAPAYRGTCYGVYEGGYIGTQTTISPWGFEVRRCPNGLSLTGGKHVVNGNDANPANVIYEIFTDPDWGLGFTSSDMDLDNFSDVANTLYTEGNGFSMVLDNPMDVSEFLSEVERQIDGLVYLDRESGKIKIKLVRADYMLADIPSLDESNVLEVRNYTRGSWHNTNNNVRVQYIDRKKEYAQTYAVAQDPANIALQGNVLVNVQETFPGVKDGTLANTIAWRGLRMSGTPLAKAQLLCNRSVANLNPGFVIKFSDATLGVSNMPMRITRIDLGKLEAGQVTLDLVQDVFKYDTPSFSDAQDSFWIDPETAPEDIVAANRQVFEAPKAFCDRVDGIYNRIWCGALYPLDRTDNFDVWTNDAGEGYAADANVAGYAIAGQLSADLPSDVQAQDVTIAPGPDTQAEITGDIESRTTREIGESLCNLGIIDEEIIGFVDAVVSGSSVTLTSVYRGLCDTAVAPHASGSKVFLLTWGNITSRAFAPGHTVLVKLLGDGPYGTQTLDLSSVTPITMDNRALRPYPPTNLRVNSVSYDDSVDMSTFHALNEEKFFTVMDVPSQENSADTSNLELGIRFKTAVDGNVLAIRFYIGDVTLNTGTHIGRIWNPAITGSPQTTVTFVTQTPVDGWVEARLATPFPVLAGVEWVASYNAPVGRYAFSLNLFVSDVTVGDITFVANGGMNGAGGTYPGNTVNHSYWVDIVFAAESESFDERGAFLEYTRRDFRTTNEVLAVLSEATIPADFPTANTTKYGVQVYNDPTGANTLLFTTGWNTGEPNWFISTSKVLRYTAGVLPTTLQFAIVTEHTVDAVNYDSHQPLRHNASVSFGDLTGDTNMGVSAVNVASTTAATAVATDTYSLRIGTAFATGAVEVQYNGAGSWTSVIAATDIDGTLAVTSGDTLKFRHTQTGSNDLETLYQLLDETGDPIAYGVFTY